MLNYQRVPLFSMWNHDCVTQLLNGRFGFQWISRILHLPHEYGHQAEYEEGSLTTPRFAIGDLKFFPIVIGNSPSCRVILWYYRSVCGYGSIPINTIFRGMNIHLPAILMWTKGVQGFDTLLCECTRVTLFELSPGKTWQWKVTSEGVERYREPCPALDDGKHMEKHDWTLAGTPYIYIYASIYTSIHIILYIYIAIHTFDHRSGWFHHGFFDISTRWSLEKLTQWSCSTPWPWWEPEGFWWENDGSMRKIYVKWWENVGKIQQIMNIYVNLLLSMEVAMGWEKTHRTQWQEKKSVAGRNFHASQLAWLQPRTGRIFDFFQR